MKFGNADSRMQVVMKTFHLFKLIMAQIFIKAVKHSLSCTVKSIASPLHFDYSIVRNSLLTFSLYPKKSWQNTEDKKIPQRFVPNYIDALLALLHAHVYILYACYAN